MSRAGIVGGLLVAVSALGACATKPVVYGPIGEKAPYGYQDRQNADGGYTVRVVMPGHSGPEALRAFFDRRAGELCPAGVERTNVFRMHRAEFGYAPYVHGGVGVGTRTAVGTELEGYVYCKAGAASAEKAGL